MKNQIFVIGLAATLAVGGLAQADTCANVGKHLKISSPVPFSAVYIRADNYLKMLKFEEPKTSALIDCVPRGQVILDVQGNFADGAQKRWLFRDSQIIREIDGSEYIQPVWREVTVNGRELTYLDSYLNGSGWRGKISH